MSEVAGEEEEEEGERERFRERFREREREKDARTQARTDEIATVIIPLLCVSVVGLTDLGQRFQNSVVQILLKVWQGSRFVVGN
jgi:hypothetical protein